MKFIVEVEPDGTLDKPTWRVTITDPDGLESIRTFPGTFIPTHAVQWLGLVIAENAEAIERANRHARRG